MKYGYFSNDGLEFVITNPVTPRPWINYLTNENYCAIISQCAGGYSFYKDCRSDRITRWQPENWHFDRPGRYIYIKELSAKRKSSRHRISDNAQQIWSATYQPLRRKPEKYLCRHGLGYTVIETTYHKINTRITYFVPPQENCEIWLVRITNQSKKKRNLQLFPYIEWLLGDYHLELRYRNIMNLYNRIWFDRENRAIFAKKTAAWDDLNIQPFPYTAFFASSLQVKGYATKKYQFLGRYNTEEKPEAIFSLKSLGFAFKRNRQTAPEELCSGEDGIGVFWHNLKLNPRETKEFVVVLGQTEGSSIKRLLSKYRNLKKAKEALDRTKSLWRKRILDNIVVETPDKDFNLMINIWVKYQLYICNFWSRSPSYYHEGSGGRGYRDSCQDAEGIMSINPDYALGKIKALASLIRRDGTCAPGYSETRGPYKHRPNKDHPVWLTSTISSYIKETGNRDILKEFAPYLKDHWIRGWDVDLNWRDGSVSDGEGTILEHLEKNLNFTFNDVGARGLPLIGHADWNDGIDAAGIKGKGESVWLAQALVRSFKQLSELAEIANERKKAREFRNKARTMAERINRHCWDGQWYVRGFTDEGYIYGSKKNKEGKIFLNSQSWAILADIVDGEKLTKILRSVDRYLNGPHSVALFYPAYSQYDSRLGRISMFSQGTKENAAVFCHAATFMIAAYLTARQGNKAYEAMCKIMPNKQKDYELYKTEPYIYAEYLVGPEHPYLYGEGAFTWITGTAGWTFLAATEYLLGARREFKGLKVDPCVPSDWKKCRIRRPFRGAIYNIEIENPHGKESGVKEIYVDGKKIEGNIIKPHRDGKVHRVKVVMG